MAGSSPSRPVPGGSRPGRSSTRPGRGGHHLRAGRRRAVRTWPRQGQYWLLDRELGGAFPQGRGRRADTGHPRHLLRADHQPVAAAGADGGRPRGPQRPGGGHRDARPVFDAAQRLVPSSAASMRSRRSRPTAPPPSPPTGSQSRRGGEPGARHRHSLDRGLVVAGHRGGGARLVAGLGLPVGGQPPDAVAALPPLPRLLEHPSPERLLASDPRYGQVVCACEQVTAAEIAAVHALAVPPRSLEGCASAPGRPVAAARGPSVWPACSSALAAQRRPASAGRRLGAGGDAGRGCRRS